MLIFEIVIFFIAVVTNCFKIKLPKVLGDIVSWGTIILFATCIIDLRIAFMLTTIAMLILGQFLADYLVNGEIKHVLITCLVSILILYWNRGITTRFFDEANVLTPIREYSLNSELAYMSSLTDYNELFIVTINHESKDHEDILKYLEKIKKNKYYYIIALYYDNEGKFLGTAREYCSRFGIKDIREEITNKVGDTSLANCIVYIPEKMNQSVIIDEQLFGGEGYSGSSNPGIHWVNGYERQDGTQVDGYWRTNPDGDPTNNFSSH